MNGKGARPAARISPLSLKKRYEAGICGDGRVLPILERLGRRHLREIDPTSSEGRWLLAEGKVTLWFDDGTRSQTAPIDRVLDQILSATKSRRDANPGLPGWTSHHEQVLKSLYRVRRSLRPGN